MASFPRKPPPDGDNIISAEEWIGDHDVRSEDRQLLLDAIMSAQERLVVIFSGCDPRSGAEIPPAVPIGELLRCAGYHGPHRGRRADPEQDHHAAPVAAVRCANFAPGEPRLPDGIQL